MKFNWWFGQRFVGLRNSIVLKSMIDMKQNWVEKLCYFQQLYWLCLRHEDFSTKTMINKKVKWKLSKKERNRIEYYHKRKITWLCTASTGVYDKKVYYRSIIVEHSPGFSSVELTCIYLYIPLKNKEYRDGWLFAEEKLVLQFL